MMHLIRNSSSHLALPEGAPIPIARDSENHPAKWFTVSFFKSDETSPVGFLRNCRDGAFSIRDIQPGTYLVRISVEPEGVMDMPKGEAFVLPRLEIRRGYFYGPINIHLQPNVKK